MRKLVFSFLILSIILINALSKTNIHPSLVQLQSNAQSFETEQCDLVVGDGICLYQGDKLLFGNARPDGLAGYWSFDDFRGMDHSGNHMHINKEITSGPGFGNQGYSAKIGANEYLVIPAAINLDSNEFSVSFWFFSPRIEFEDPQAMTGWRYCPLLYKGSLTRETSRKEEIRSPAIFLDRKDRVLRVHLSKIVDDTQVEGETIYSNSRITYNKWTHITVVKLAKKVKLYINGILDSIANTEGTTFVSDSPLYIGNHPDYIDQCDISGYIDELRFYTRPLKAVEIQAEASGALGNAQSGYIQLGCVNCPLSIAKGVCVEGYHLCTTMELHSQAFQVAKTMGWLEWNSKIWSYSAALKAAAAAAQTNETAATNATTGTNEAQNQNHTQAQTKAPEELGIGICCAD